MGVARTDDGSVYFEMYGEGEPLVLICGITGSVDYYWQAILADLSSRFQVIAFDNRGMGKTVYNNRSFSLEKIAEDVTYLLDHLGIEKASLFGHSMGSAITQIFAKHYPHRIEKAILCNTFSKLRMRDQILLQGIDTLSKENIPISQSFMLLLPWIFSDEFLENPAVFERLKSFYEKRVISQMGLQHQIEALISFNSEKWIEEIDIETLVIGSKDDIMFPPELGKRISEKMKNATYVELEGGHGPHVERPLQLTALIKDFLS